MRFLQKVECVKNMKDYDSLVSLFDDVSYTLGFFVPAREKNGMLDTEFSLVLLGYLFEQRELGLNRFLGSYVGFLRGYHGLLNPHKLLLMTERFEELMGGEHPYLQLMRWVLKDCDPKRFKAFEAKPLSRPYYPVPEESELTDLFLDDVGFFAGMPKELNLMLSPASVRLRNLDLLPRDSFLKKNEQMRLRLFFGPNYRGDAVLLLSEKKDMSVKELSETILLSYEPCYRLMKELKTYHELGFSLRAGA